MAEDAYMFGFMKSDPDTVGFLKVTKTGYEVVPDRSDATPFPETNRRRLKGWAKPEKWLKFFSEEKELAGWKFHIVKFISKENVK